MSERAKPGTTINLGEGLEAVLIEDQWEVWKVGDDGAASESDLPCLPGELSAEEAWGVLTAWRGNPALRKAWDWAVKNARTHERARVQDELTEAASMIGRVLRPLVEKITGKGGDF